MKKLNQIKQQFKNKSLLKKALTHKSWLNESEKETESYERLEFLGDAVLELVVSKELYNRFPKKNEGFLTLARSNIVNNTNNLSSISEKIGLGEGMHLSKGEEAEGGRTKSSLLADVLEAVIGAIYLDQGLQVAEEFIIQNIMANIDESVAISKKDSKSKLQELVQAEGNMAPIYKVVKESGPDHDKTFLVQVLVNKNVVGKGKGRSKNTAEQAAATDALDNIASKK